MDEKTSTELQGVIDAFSEVIVLLCRHIERNKNNFQSMQFATVLHDALRTSRTNSANSQVRQAILESIANRIKK